MNSSPFLRRLCVVVLLLISISATINSAPSPTSQDSLPDKVTTISLPPLRETKSFEQQREKSSKILRRMILPLLIGILLKVSSLLPVILGKLTLMAFGSLMTSKLALAIAGFLIIHKYHSEHSWSTFLTGHSQSVESEDPYSTYAVYRRRG